MKEATVSYQTETTLEDGVKVIVLGEVFMDPIHRTGDVNPYTQVRILNGLNTEVLMGIVYYENPLGEDDLQLVTDKVAADPEHALFSTYKQKVKK